MRIPAIPLPNPICVIEISELNKIMNSEEGLNEFLFWGERK